MKVNRKELIRVIAVVCVAWAALLFFAARWQRHRLPKAPPAGPQLIHYPGTEGIEEQTSPNIGLRKYWFKLNEDYPSKSVFYFYQNELEPKGWQRMGTAEPQWARQEVKGKAHDILRSLWVSPDRLFQLELEMMSVAAPIRSGDETVSEDREPGIRVYVTLRRTLHPGIMLQRPAAEPPRAGIEVPDSDR